MHSVLLSKHWLPVCFISTIPLFFSPQETIEVTEASMHDHLSGKCIFAMNTVLTHCLCIPFNSKLFRNFRDLADFHTTHTSEQHLDQLAIKVWKLGLVPTLMLKAEKQHSAVKAPESNASPR